MVDKLNKWNFYFTKQITNLRTTQETMLLPFTSVRTIPSIGTQVWSCMDPVWDKVLLWKRNKLKTSTITFSLLSQHSSWQRQVALAKISPTILAVNNLFCEKFHLAYSTLYPCLPLSKHILTYVPCRSMPAGLAESDRFEIMFPFMRYYGVITTKVWSLGEMG